MSRRQALAVLGGLPMLAACPRRETRVELRVPPGELVGASFERGHRLRQTPPAWTPDGESRQVVVVGGGAAGLAAAWRLKKRGVEDVLVLELEDALGGTARAGTVAGQAVPWGAHYIALPRGDNAPLVELLGELGALESRDPPVAREDVLVRDPEERVYYKGRWSEGLYLNAGASAEDRRQLEAFEAEIAGWVAFRDASGRRAFDLPVVRCSDDPAVTALDGLSMAAWLDARRLDSPRLRWLVEYACRDDYGATAAQVSAWAGIFYFASRVASPGQESAPLLTWPEGNGRLIGALARGVESRRGWTVLDVDPQADHVRLTTDRGALRAGHVVLAVPQHVVARILAPWRAAPPAHLAAFQTSAWMVANLALSARPRDRGFPLAWDNVLHESDALGYVVATHQEGRDHGPTVITYFLPFLDDDARAGRQRLYAGDREHWARVALEDLARAHPDLPALCQRVDVMRWGHAMVRPAPGLMWGGARRAAATMPPRVHVAHTDLSGLALFEEAFHHGVRAADEIAG